MFSWWELMVGTAKANGCFLTNTHACVTHCVCVRVCVGIIMLQGRGWCPRAPWGCLPFSRALECGARPGAPQEETPAQKG